MRLLSCLFLVCLSAASFAAAPPAKVPAEVLKLIEQLGDEDKADAAVKKLTDLGDPYVNVFRALSKMHSDVDVRLRLVTIAAAIESVRYGEVRRFTVHGSAVTALALSPDGKRIATGSGYESGNPVARILDVESGKELFQLKGHTVGVNRLDWSSDGAVILSTDGEGSIRTWDAKTGKQRFALEVAGPVYRAAFTPDGKRFVFSSTERTVRLHDARTGKLVRSFTGHKAECHGLAVSADGKRLVTVSDDGAIRFFDLGTGKLTLQCKTQPDTFCAAFSPDGRRLATSGKDGKVRIWNANTGVELEVWEGHTDLVWDLAYSRDGTRLLSASHDNTARLWHATAGKELQRLEGQTGAFHRVIFTRDGSHALTGCHDGSVRLWRLRR